MLKPQEVLDRYYLETRCMLLETAAVLDRYDAAVEMLNHLQIARIQLLTNNPEKVRALRIGGIDVADRQPLYGTLNRHNLPYVRAKVDRAGHWLSDMLSSPMRGK